MNKHDCKYSNISDWDSSPTLIESHYFKGEGYLIPLPNELYNKHAYDLDRYAEKWLTNNKHKVREDVSAGFWQNKTMLWIMSVDEE